jgi:hypothetical protein
MSDREELILRLEQLRDVSKRLAAEHAAYGGHLYSGHMGRARAFDEAIEAAKSILHESGTVAVFRKDAR